MSVFVPLVNNHITLFFAHWLVCLAGKLPISFVCPSGNDDEDRQDEPCFCLLSISLGVCEIKQKAGIRKN
jgi:hypothetical protein